MVLEGTVAEALLNAVAGGGQVINLHGIAVPFAVEVASDSDVA